MPSSLAATGGLVTLFCTSLSVVARAPVASPAPMQWKAVGVTVVAIWPGAGIVLGLMSGLLAAGNEGRQTVDLALGIALSAALLRLRALGLLQGLGLARHIGLWLARSVGRFRAASG